MIGVYKNDVYCSRLDQSPYVKEISRENEEYHLYTRLDTGLHYAEPKKSEYLSSDGHLYVMECFEDRVEISELMLEPDTIAYELAVAQLGILTAPQVL